MWVSVRVWQLIQPIDGHIQGCLYGTAKLVVRDGQNAKPHASGVRVDRVLLHLQFVAELGLVDVPVHHLI